MARLPYVDPAAASEEVRGILDRLPVKLNVFRMMAHAQTCFRPLIGLGTAILSRQQLAPKLRELVILRVAQQSPARYEWVQHVPIGLAAGLTAQQIDALDRGDIDSSFSREENLVLRFATELVHGVRASDAIFAELTARFTPQEIVELILTAGYYMMLARLMETTGVDLEADAGTKIVDALK